MSNNLHQQTTTETGKNCSKNYSNNNNHGTPSRKRHCPENRSNNISPTKSVWKKRRFKDDRRFVVPPRHFLLGGNIHDPLNLKSIDDTSSANNSVDDDIHHQNQDSSIGTPGKVDVLIPPNLHDPLNLETDHGMPMPINAAASGSKRNKRVRTSSESEIGRYSIGTVSGQCSSKIKDDTFVNHHGQKKLSRFNHKRQSGNSNFDRYRSNYHHRDHQQDQQQLPSLSSTSSCDKKPSGIQKNCQQFQYGNFNRYYGYRNCKEKDTRIQLFRPEMFANKDVLDIGCNTGDLTITIAKDFAPRKMIGIDIDPRLIMAARKNLRHHSTEKLVEIESMPISMPALYGLIEWIPSLDQESFPNNVHFVDLNYVPESDRCLVNQQPEYDTILCLSVTKWIHLNWGDSGLKRLFRRIFLHLRPGGCLILEPQPWSSYHKRSKITSQISENYRSIRFKPEHFHEYLLKEVGFKSCELLGTPDHDQKGFQRTIYMYTKK